MLRNNNHRSICQPILMVIWSCLCFVGVIPSIWAGTVELVIPPYDQSGFMQSANMTGTSALSISSAAEVQGIVDTPTSFYAFVRYPEKSYGFTPRTPQNNNAKTMQGVALIKDEAVSVWWYVYGVWENEGLEDWEFRFTKPDGTVSGVHWHSEMKTVNDVYQKCFISSDPVTEELKGEFCADDPVYGQAKLKDILFGWTHTISGLSGPQSVNKKIEVWTAALSHNGEAIWQTPWLLGDLRLMNPNSGSSFNNLIDSDGQLTSDLQQISTSSAPVPTHVAADGVTPLLFRVGSTPAVPVTIKVANGSTADGTLTDFYSEGQTGSASVSPGMRTAANGNDYGVGLYTAPSEFSSVSSSVPYRTVQLQVEFAVPWQSSPAILPVSFKLVRPPLVMIHGMWSTPKVWDKLYSSGEVCGLSRLCLPVNWSPADTPLKDNILKVSIPVQNHLAFLRNGWETIHDAVAQRYVLQNMAITQMDVIAHSAGGPLFRLYDRSESGKRPDNFFLGDFRKMLTLGSPHRGTPIADFVSKLLSSGNPAVIDKMKNVFAISKRNPSKGIIEDLQTISPTIQSIQPTEGPAHAWIGSLPSLTNLSEKILWDTFTAICFLPSSKILISECQGILLDAEILRSRVFSGQVNDGFVNRDSQAGGITISAQTNLSNTAHTKETEAVSPSDIAALLDGTGGTLDSGGFG